MDNDGKPCKVGEAGEFWVKGWAVMDSYWNDEAATQDSITEDGWMKSGDLGVLDESGYLSIVGRKKDMIIRGGENIYPKEIEEFIAKMEGIVDVQVVSIPDEKYGEEVVAVIKVQDLAKNSITREDVFRYCKDKIAFYKIPKFIKFVSDYPLTVSGKVQKFVMRGEL